MSPCSPRNVPYRVRIAGNQGRRHQVRIAVDVDLLRRVAHLGRVVHDQGRRMDMLEKVGRRDVGHVEGRVLAQQDRVHLRQVGEPRFAEIGMAALLGPHPQALHRRAQHALAEAQRVRRVVMQRMAARLRLHGQHESAVRRDVDGVDGIHLDRHAQRHVTLLPCFAGSPKASPWPREAGPPGRPPPGRRRPCRWTDRSGFTEKNRIGPDGLFDAAKPAPASDAPRNPRFCRPGPRSGAQDCEALGRRGGFETLPYYRAGRLWTPDIRCAPSGVTQGDCRSHDPS